MYRLPTGAQASHGNMSIPHLLPVIESLMSHRCCFFVQATEYNTHRWTVFLRGPNNEDLSHIISKARDTQDAPWVVALHVACMGLVIPTFARQGLHVKHYIVQ
jgi:hypothetical protein